MIFQIIDRRTGRKPTNRVINNIAKKGNLITCDIEGFFVSEEGQIILADECGNFTYVDPQRMTAKVTDNALVDYCKIRRLKLLSESYYRTLMKKLYYLEEKVKQLEDDGK